MRFKLLMGFVNGSGAWRESGRGLRRCVWVRPEANGVSTHTQSCDIMPFLDGPTQRKRAAETLQKVLELSLSSGFFYSSRAELAQFPTWFDLPGGFQPDRSSGVCRAAASLFHQSYSAFPAAERLGGGRGIPTASKWLLIWRARSFISD